MEEKKIPVITHKAEGKVVIGEAVVREDGTVSMELTKEGLDLIGFEVRPGDFSVSWYREYTEAEREAMRRRALESPFRSKYETIDEEYPKIYEKILPDLDNYGGVRRYQGPPLRNRELADERPRENPFLDKVKNLKICTCQYSTKPCNVHPQEEPNVEG